MGGSCDGAVSGLSAIEPRVRALAVQEDFALCRAGRGHRVFRLLAQHGMAAGTAR